MDRPILFRGEMVRAILDGRKTQTRRVVKPGPGQKWLTPETISEVRRFANNDGAWWTMAVGEPRRIVHCGQDMDGGHIGSVRCPYGTAGDRLWVKETWAADPCFDHLPPRKIPEGRPIYFGAGTEKPLVRGYHRVRPSIFMRQWMSGITLDVLSVRVERLHEITEKDAKAEGAAPDLDSSSMPYVSGFSALWHSIHGAESWDANPWLWVISFKRAEVTCG